MRKENPDFVDDKCVTDDSGNLSISEDAKKTAWKKHHERLLNVEFPWAEDVLPAVEHISGPPIFVSSEMVLCTLRKMKYGKATGPSGIVGEMLKSSPDVCSRLIADICNAIVKEGRIPDEWNDSFIISLLKWKGDALDRGNYRGLKLKEQVLKVIERIIENIIR